MTITAFSSALLLVACGTSTTDTKKSETTETTVQKDLTVKEFLKEVKKANRSTNTVHLEMTVKLFVDFY